jgi:hypothetical protein
MLNRIGACVATTLFLSLTAVAPAMAAAPKVYTLDGEYLEIAKQRLSANDTKVKPAYDALIAKADKALNAEPEAVTKKGLTPPSGDKHDYMSMGPYWWPNPDTKDGLPYIRKDGQTNPSSKNGNTDSVRMQFMCNGAQNLALAYYFSGDKKYADKAAAFIRTWFLDPATRMNPNLRFGQAVPGVVDGRGIGLIDTRNFWMVIDAVGLIQASGALKPAEVDALKAWFSEFATWMVVSPTAREEFAWGNNHGTFFDAQLANYALFIGDTDLATRVVKDAQTLRMAAQIARDGKIWYELERTQPYHYTVFNLEAQTRLARYSEQVKLETNTWNLVQDERSIKTAVDYAVGFVKDPKSWPFKDMKGVEFDSALNLILQSARAWPQEKDKYAALLPYIPASLSNDSSWLLWPLK